eukprot:CAMPEP_0118657158 /NCGR_PEP_ID=MMETSP0785-20121206/13868_1 /TAXON_ID=91992 /ORGANISM="Bolidomonas pacifica, Strain CCMP 1866" /LENGTH=134 /DNA_ID=CAMNT_0006550055 /DNA_START=37 /DNA_END=438 /DNA_ORIENTATION=-
MEYLSPKYTNPNLLDTMDDDKSSFYSSMMSKYEDCVKCDKWGQVVEAVEAYQDLERTMTRRAEEGRGLRSKIGKMESDNMTMFARCIKLRIACIEKGIDGPMVEDMEVIMDRFVAIVTGMLEFPILVDEFEVGD